VFGGVFLFCVIFRDLLGWKGKGDRMVWDGGGEGTKLGWLAGGMVWDRKDGLKFGLIVDEWPSLDGRVN